jgi:hypothetical protein
MKELVIFSGEVVGEGRSVPCEVRATKTTLDGHPEIPPGYSGYHVMNSDAMDSCRMVKTRRFTSQMESAFV